jgi:hypothetical protein
MALNLVHSPEGTCGQKHFDGALVTHTLTLILYPVACPLVFMAA